MPDTDPNSKPSDEPDGGSASAATDDAQDSALGDGGKKALDAERDARKAAEKSLKDAQKSIDDLAAKVKSFEDRDKSDADKAADRIAELEKALKDKDTELSKAALGQLRTKVANREGKQVPVAALTGTTEEELIACADRLLEWRGHVSQGSFRKRGLQSGAGAPPDGSTDKEKAAAALRAMRAGH